MALFDFLRKKQNHELNANESNESEEDKSKEETIIDRNLFIKEPNRSSDESNEDSSTAWKRIFNKIRKDFESEGYNDALSTADVKYRNDNNEILKLNLLVDIEEAEVEIKEYLKELDFHIKSRAKAELLDLVEELESKKVIYEERLEKLKEIKSDLKNDSGIPNRMLLAYNRGFNKGMAALSVANVINKHI